MTESLQSIFDQASRLPEAEQDRIAQWLAQELREEHGWDTRFSQSGSALKQMASEALEEHRSGKTLPLDPEEL